MQIKLGVVKMSQEKEEEKISDKEKFMIELLIMTVVGLLVIVPLILYGYHFLI